MYLTCKVELERVILPPLEPGRAAGAEGTGGWGVGHQSWHTVVTSCGFQSLEPKQVTSRILSLAGATFWYQNVLRYLDFFFFLLVFFLLLKKS